MAREFESLRDHQFLRRKQMDKFGSNAYLYLDKKNYFKLRLKYFIIGILSGIILTLIPLLNLIIKG